MNCIKCDKETEQEVHLPSSEKHPVKDVSYYIPVPLCPECMEKLKSWLRGESNV